MIIRFFASLRMTEGKHMHVLVILNMHLLVILKEPKATEESIG
jgi:hypothetical protein